jgi:hypothetical protein
LDVFEGSVERTRPENRDVVSDHFKYCSFIWGKDVRDLESGPQINESMEKAQDQNEDPSLSQAMYSVLSPNSSK